MSRYKLLYSKLFNKIWDVCRGSETRQTRLYNAKSISCIAYNSMGNMIACAGNDVQINILK
jgi:hypothetical protein